MPSGWLRRLFLVQIFLLTAVVSAADVGKAQESGTKKEQTGDEIETEHIFGFTEGTDIGRLGEREIESTFVGGIGKIGSYANLSNETSFRYVVTDRLRLSVGTLTDFFSIHGVPNLTNRTLAGFSGLDAEARLSIVDRHNAPFGMDLGITPQWRRLDDLSGAQIQTYAMPTTLVIEKDFLSENIFAAANFTYTPALARVDRNWQHENSFESSAAVSGAVIPTVLVGAEIRHLALAENGTFKAQALFIGPSFYTRLSETLEAKIAWSAQVSALSKQNLDLESFDRHQIILVMSYTF